MKKLRLEIELEYEEDLMYTECAESKQWFMEWILCGDTGQLILHSNEIGDEIGPVTVIRHLPT